MRAVVLAAGKGVRMLPLTEDRPKVLVEVLGKPFLWYVLRNLRDAGITDVCLIVGYKKEAVERFAETLGATLPELSVTLVEQKEQLGTGHATALARHFVGNEPFLSVNGDNLYSVRDLKELAKARSTTVAGIEADNPERYGVLVCDGDRLVKILEKPKVAPSRLINAAAYVFTPEIFAAIEKIGKSPRGEYEITDAISILAAERKVRVYRLRDRWKDFGRKEDIPEMEAFLRAQS